MIPNESKATLASLDEIAERIRRINQETIDSYQRQIDESNQRWKAQGNPPEVTPQPKPEEYVPLTTQELYEARQSNSPAWTLHLDELAKQYVR